MLSPRLARIERFLATISFALGRRVRYLAAMVLVGIALAMRLVIAPADAGLPYVTFFPAAALAAIIGGLGPGLLASWLGAVLVYVLFSPGFDATAALAMLVYVADGLIVCVAVEAMRRYYLRNAATAAALERTVERLTTSNAELERFAYVAAHDLQEPLRSITSFSQLIVRDYADRLDERGRDYLRFVADGGQRMHDMITNLLDYSRLAFHASRPARVSADGAVQAAVESLATAIQDSGATIAVDPLPEVWANEVQLLQVFQHLLDNAIKFRAPGRPLHLAVTARRHGSEWIFSVADNGVGFDPSERDVFEIFRQLHHHGAYPGQGVGLAICKRIVLGHDGRIWVDSKPGEGSTFYFSLPDPAGHGEGKGA